MFVDYLCIENCRGCGQLVKPTAGNPQCVCLRCWDKHATSPPHVELCQTAQGSLMVASGTEYSGILKKMIYRLKYDKDKPVVNDLIDLAARALDTISQSAFPVKQATLVPVPLHWMRLLVRGYNQAELIAEGLGRRYRLQLDSRLVSRRRRTQPQHGLGKEERQKNIAGAFRVNRWAAEHPCPIIVVDDLYTSGATISEIARALQLHGFTSICAVTAARAVFSKEDHVQD